MEPAIASYWIVLAFLLGQGFAVALQAADRSLEEVVVTTRRLKEPTFTTPHTVEVIDAQRIKVASFRSTPDIFREVPGAMVQKTPSKVAQSTAIRPKLD